jgi:hypothetical protein
MKNTVLTTEIILYNNSQQPSSTTTVDEDRPANTPLAPLLDNNNLSRACELQSVSNASADIVLGDNAGTVIKNE